MSCHIFLSCFATSSRSFPFLLLSVYGVSISLFSFWKPMYSTKKKKKEKKNEKAHTLCCKLSLLLNSFFSVLKSRAISVHSQTYGHLSIVVSKEESCADLSTRFLLRISSRINWLDVFERSTTSKPTDWKLSNFFFFLVVAAQRSHYNYQHAAR